MMVFGNRVFGEVIGFMRSVRHREESQSPVIGLACLIINTKNFVSFPSLTLTV